MDPLKLTKDKRQHSLEAMHPEARPHFAELLAEVRRKGWHPYISSAVRTFREQGDTASKATRGCSWHQFGRAIDLDVNGTVAWDADTYGYLGAWWKARGPGFTWGGDWKTKYPPHGDFTHFQYAPTSRPSESLCSTRDAAAFRRYWRRVSGTGPGRSFLLWLLAVPVAVGLARKASKK